jgi:hypothetical protein
MAQPRFHGVAFKSKFRDMNNDTSYYGGVGFSGLLQVVFITLKILGKITWSWWFVLMPTWIGIALFLFLVGIVVVVSLISAKREGGITSGRGIAKTKWQDRLDEMKRKQDAENKK